MHDLCVCHGVPSCIDMLQLQSHGRSLSQNRSAATDDVCWFACPGQALELRANAAQAGNSVHPDPIVI